jgi:hypothetical protein
MGREKAETGKDDQRKSATDAKGRSVSRWHTWATVLGGQAERLEGLRSTY